MNRKYSYNWLKEYIKTDKSVNEFARELSLKSMTVDRVGKVKPKFKGVITAKILEIKKHPDADKLQLAKVDAGRTKPTVVCGAPNIAVGQMVPLAVVGAKVVDPQAQDSLFTIKEAKIRGVKSRGMLCAQDELGLGDDHEGIMVLNDNTPIGKPLEEVLELDDYLLDIEITSNRPDAMSVTGLAREAAAATGGKLNLKVPQPNLDVKKEFPMSVEVVESELCPRYQAVVMTDVKVGPSPLWLQLRLLQAGLRPINNLADITNYILLEYGRPMHVFDYKKLHDQKIIIRNAKRGEKILALDGQTYKLNPDHLVIADGKAPVAIAGVMGGEKFSVSPKTKTIVFESATFDPISIRKTARALNLHSDSSDLFEKDLHPETTFVGMLRAIELTKKLAGGKVASPIIDIYAQDYKPTKIKFDTASIKRHLGVEIEIDQVKKILESLGFEVSGAKILNVTVPYWRAGEVEFEHDLIEEIARIYGYHNIPSELPIGKIPIRERDQQFFWEDKVKDILAGLNFSEVFNYSMLSKEYLKKVKFPVKDLIKINNPLNEEMEYMRPTLLAQILQNISDNQKNFANQKIFEISNVYIPSGENELPDEIEQLTGAMLLPNPFLPVKGVAEILLKKMGIADYNLVVTDSKCPLWEKQKALDIYKGKKFLGQFGLIKLDILSQFNINKPLAVFVFDFSEITNLATTTIKYQPIPEFPSVERDLAIVVDQKLSWAEINQTVVKVDPLIVAVKYLSTFTDPSLGKNNKSLAFRIVFRSAKRTLKSEEVDAIINVVVKKLEKGFEAKLR